MGQEFVCQAGLVSVPAYAGGGLMASVGPRGSASGGSYGYIPGPRSSADVAGYGYIPGRVLERELVVFDTETTGLDGGAEIVEIVEISCVNGRGEVLLDTLVRPAGPIPADATAIHRITYDDVLGQRPSAR